MSRGLAVSTGGERGAMGDDDYRAFALVAWPLFATLLNTLKRSGKLSLEEEAEIYETVLQQLEHQQATSGDQAGVVRRAREMIEEVIGVRRHPPDGRSE